MKRADAETLVLGVALHDAETARLVVDALNADHFRPGFNRELFRLITQALTHFIGGNNGHATPTPVIESLARDQGRPIAPSVLMELYDAADPALAAVFIEAVKGRARRPKRASASEAAPHVGEHLSDLGNARRLVAQHGEDLRYSHPLKRWFHWDGQRWASDTTGQVMRWAKATGATIYEEAKAAPDDKIKMALAQHAVRSEAERKLAAMITLAQSEPGIPITPDQLDADPWLLNVENGTVDLRMGDLRPHRREDRITKLVPIAYDPDARCPLWDRFLEEDLFPDQPGTIDYMQRAAGYALTGDVSEQVFFIHYGLGNNGKSTYSGTLTAALGDYARSTSSETLLTRRKGIIPNDVARLQGARLVTAIETEANRHLAEGLVKGLTGGDTIPARFLFSEWFEFRPTFKLLLSVNHKPVIRGTDHAIWRRVRLVPFTREIPPERRDPHFGQKLATELPGILAWAVRGCLAWQVQGLPPPAEVWEATEDYRCEQDSLADFLDQYVIADDVATVKAGDLYRAYRHWHEASGERKEDVLSQKRLGMELGKRKFTREKIGGGIHVWRGLRLRDGKDS